MFFKKYFKRRKIAKEWKKIWDKKLIEVIVVSEKTGIKLEDKEITRKAYDFTSGLIQKKYGISSEEMMKIVCMALAKHEYRNLNVKL